MHANVQDVFCANRYNDNALADVKERDAALSRQRELVSEVSDLRSRLDSLKSTCHELRLKNTSNSPDLHHRDEDKGTGEDEEVRVLMVKIAGMLSDEFVTVQPRQHSIFKHLRLLVDSVHAHNAVCISLGSLIRLSRHVMSYIKCTYGNAKTTGPLCFTACNLQVLMRLAPDLPQINVISFLALPSNLFESIFVNKVAPVHC